MHIILPHIAIVKDGANINAIHTGSSLDDLVRFLFQTEEHRPVVILTDGHWIHYEYQVFHYCFIKGKITVTELINSVRLSNTEASQLFRPLSPLGRG